MGMGIGIGIGLGSSGPAAPPAPTSFVVTANQWYGNRLGVTFSAVPASQQFAVEYSTNGSSWSSGFDAATAATSGTITGLTRQTAYYVRIRAESTINSSVSAWVYVGGGASPGTTVTTIYDPSVASFTNWDSIGGMRFRGQLWQNTAKTVAATAADDPVRVAVTIDGIEYTAPSDAARPLLKNDGTSWYLKGDGVNDYLEATGLSITGTTIYGGARIQQSSSDPAWPRLLSLSTPGVVDGDSVQRIALLSRNNTSDRLTLQCNGNYTLCITDLADDTTVTAEAVVTGGQALLGLNGVDSATTATSMNLNSTLVGLLSGPIATSSAGRLYAFAIGTTIPTRASMRTWLGGV